MKNIYKMIGLLIVLTLIMVGCSSEDPDSVESEVEEPAQSQEDIAEEVEEPEEEVTSDGSSPEIKSKVLRDIMNMNRYTMKVKNMSTFQGKDLEIDATHVVADGQFATITEVEGGDVINIIKDGKFYMVLDSEKTIIVQEYEDEEDLIGNEEYPRENEEIFPSDLKYIGKGKDTFLGNQRSYEEYKIDMGTIRYYFDGNELDGMMTTVNMGELMDDDEDMEFEDSSFIMDVKSISKDVDMSVFELPEDYQVIGE